MASLGLHKRRSFPKPKRICFSCNGPIPDDEKAVKAKTTDDWKHWECWYDGGSPFPRNPKTGKLL